MSTVQGGRCEQSEVTCAYAAQALAPSEIAAAEVHIASCAECRRELKSLRAVVDRFVSWPADVLRPTTSLHQRLALRISERDRDATSAAAGATVVRARMGTGRARD